MYPYLNSFPFSVIIDDFMVEGSQEEEFREILTQGSHHAKISILYTMQNMFFQSTNGREAKLPGMTIYPVQVTLTNVFTSRQDSGKKYV